MSLLDDLFEATRNQATFPAFARRRDIQVLDDQIAALEGADVGLDNRVDALEAADVALDGRLDALEAAEAWIAPALLNGWINQAGTYAPARYYKDPWGTVHFRGH